MRSRKDELSALTLPKTEVGGIFVRKSVLPPTSVTLTLTVSLTENLHERYHPCTPAARSARGAMGGGAPHRPTGRRARERSERPGDGTEPGGGLGRSPNTAPRSGPARSACCAQRRGALGGEAPHCERSEQIATLLDLSQSRGSVLIGAQPYVCSYSRAQRQGGLGGEAPHLRAKRARERSEQILFKSADCK